MTQERPKRKAAANKNYLDTIPDALLEGNVSSGPGLLRNSPSTASSPSKPSASNGVSQRGRARGSSYKNGSSVPFSATLSQKFGSSNVKLPINWVPPVRAYERFSHRLNLKDAFIDMDTQTLTCPNQPLIDAVPSDSTEERELQRLIWNQTGQRKELRLPARKQKGVFQLSKGDYIYMVSEPPGEPYYIGRLMGFHTKGIRNTENVKEDIASSYEFLIQWFYRPRDISKNTLDSRLLYASMHSDTCPITSFRGLVTVKHKLEVEKFYVPKLSGSAGESLTAMEYYVLLPNCFYFDKLFDRYMIKFYDIIKTSSLLEFLDNETNNNRNYILALNKRYEFVFMEAPRTKVFINNFTSTLSTHCNICAEWCPSAESVTCSECDSHFHMLCLDPPLLKKPSRGFSWTCAPCSKKREIEHLSKKMLMLSHDNKTTNEDEILLKESLAELEESNPPDGSGPSISKNPDGILAKYEVCAIDYLRKDAAVSVSERRLLEEWNIRYLGLHCRLEDAVDPDDRSPYPRASTSLGPKYQAGNIPEYEDHPIIYYDAEKTGKDKRKIASGKKGQKKKSETLFGRLLSVPAEFEDVPPQEYPSWLQPRPKGYIERGVDDGEGETCTLLWKTSERDKADYFENLDSFVTRCAPYAEKLGLHPNSPNFMDAILKSYMSADGDIEKALFAVRKLTRKSLKEPTFSKDEQRRFEAGVKKYGSELHPICKEVKTQSSAAIVRYYYIWKKTPKGQSIWGNYPGRKKKKNKNPEMKVISPGDAFADSDDDSSYENDKIIDQNKLFECKHCRLYVSEAWYKITGSDKPESSFDVLPEKQVDAIGALCFRCAKLWRRYAVYWEDPLEVERKNTKGVGGYKRKVESELVTDSERILMYAEYLLAVLTPETPKSKVLCSVISESALFKNGTNGTVALEEKQERSLFLKEEESPFLVPATVSDPNANMTARQLSLSKKEKMKEAITEPVKKKRKTEAKPKAESQNGSEVVKKRSAASKKDPNSKRPKKANQSVQQENSTLLNTDMALKLEPVQLMSPVFNSSYAKDVLSLESLQSPTKLSQLLHNTISRAILGNLTEFVTSLKKLFEPSSSVSEGFYQKPQAGHSVHVSGNEISDHISKYLTCRTCQSRVLMPYIDEAEGVRASLFNYWQCERCVNDMNPMYSTDYSCCLCANHDSFNKKEILAHSDYLVPVLASGKWCHLSCAIFFGDNLSFQRLHRLELKGNNTLLSVMYSGISVNHVMPLLLRNVSVHCQICQSREGALIECSECSEEKTRAHLNCVLTAPNFHLGFFLYNGGYKTTSLVWIQQNQGLLKPAMICHRHERPTNFHRIGADGKKLLNGEPDSLILLYLDGLRGTYKDVKGNGDYSHAHSYLLMINKQAEGLNSKKATDVKKASRCCVCNISSSPKWWPLAEARVSTTASNRSPSFLDGKAEYMTHQVTENISQSQFPDVSGDISLQTPVLRRPIPRSEPSIISRDSQGLLSSLLSAKPRSLPHSVSLEMTSSNSRAPISTRAASLVGNEAMFACQRCHFSGAMETQSAEGDDFLNEINQPISCPQEGISGPEDQVSSIYKSSLSERIHKEEKI